MRSASLLLCCLIVGACDREAARDASPTPSTSSHELQQTRGAGAPASTVAPEGSVDTSSSGFGGEIQPSAPPESPPAAAAPIPRGKVPTSLTQNPPHAVKGDPRGPIEVKDDADWLRRMSYASITKATQNKGGSTVTIRLFFEDGYRAVLKADQKKSATNFRSEIVAYHLDRLLGCARTAPVVGRELPRAALRRLLQASNADQKFLDRFDDELNEPEPDSIRGAVIAWHTQRLYSLAVPRSWPKWLGRSLEAGASSAEPAPSAGTELGSEAIPTAMKPQLPALAELSAFDYLLDNTDRWSGGNTLLLGEGGPMIFLDNGAGFADWRMQRKLALDGDLQRVCVFPRGLEQNLRALGPDVPEAQRLSRRLARSLSKDPLSPVLSEEHLVALDSRLERLLAHIDSCRK